MVVRERPDTPRIGQMPLDLKRPALERRFPFPKKFAVTMNSSTVAIVFRTVVTEETQIQKIGCPRQEFERREIAFVQRAGVGPNPADTMFLEKMNDLWTMPAGVTELDRKAEVARELFEKFPQRLTPILWDEGGRQLDQDNLKLRFEQFDR